jgi:CheY-like chemotaxis protein
MHRPKKAVAAPPPTKLVLRPAGGLGAPRRTKVDNCTNTFPVVALTSPGEDRDIVESYHLDTNSFIDKPVNFEAFDWPVVNWAPNGC